MARERDGWEYVDGRPRWAPTVEVALANILVGKYGDEYDETKRELDDLVRAAQRDAAELLRTHQVKDPLGADFYVPLGLGYAADLIHPDYPEESDSE
ncbi:hypothetical protein SEA_ISSMI_65 [Streptomyces phage Issmi]|uniref:Uncharacterized protein n=1 Tax=Streptomyces phage Issmi TaxID=2725628 RepID=A0A6M3T9C0_9CAUD|nr:hypothetical protein KGG87_gp65 [Streptomyces phage Issmi]QJD50711.1 hypothetical protein SEA_ISSMI_65 [Streptomyces phage Issmi]